MNRIAHFTIPHPANDTKLADRGVPQLLGGCACALLCTIGVFCMFDSLTGMDVVRFATSSAIIVILLVATVLLARSFIKNEASFCAAAAKEVETSVASNLEALDDPQASEWLAQETMCFLSSSKSEYTPALLRHSGSPSYIASFHDASVGEHKEVEIELFSDDEKVIDKQ